MVIDYELSSSAIVLVMAWSKRRELVLGLAILCVAMSGVLLYWFLVQPQAKTKTNEALSQEFAKLNPDFPIYSPAGFLKDKNYEVEKVAYSDGILSFRVVDAENKGIVISEQSVPPELEQSIPQGGEQVKTHVGTATVNLLSDRTTAIVIANNKTLVSISTDTSIPIDDLRNILRSLQKT